MEEYANVYRRLLAAYGELQQTTRDDASMTIVDLAPPGGFAEWFHAASESEIDGLVATTPARMPVPVLAFGLVSLSWGPLIAILKSSDAHPDVIDVALWFTDTATRFADFQLVLNDKFIFESVAYKDEANKVHARGMGATLAAALCMFHVKNVAIEPRTVPRHIRRQAKREGRDLGRVVYSTLVIRPFRESRLQAARDSSGGGGSNPLHLVRGHFAHYTDEHPLFGKYPGTFWRPSHFAGNRNDGMTRKTYHIQPKAIQ